MTNLLLRVMLTPSTRGKHPYVYEQILPLPSTRDTNDDLHSGYDGAKWAYYCVIYLITGNKI